MNYSLESFYEVVKQDLLNNKFLFDHFKDNNVDIMLSFMQHPPQDMKHHFEKIDFIFLSKTPYGEFIEVLELILTDYNHRRGLENLYFAIGVSLFLMVDMLHIMREDISKHKF